MDIKRFILGSYDRARDYTLRSTQELGPEEYLWRPGPAANPIAFMLLHVSRGEDNTFQRYIMPSGSEVWAELGLDQRYGLPADGTARAVASWTTDEMRSFVYPAFDEMLEYMAAVRERALKAIQELDLARLDDQLRPDRPGSVGAYLYGAPQHESGHRGAIEYLRGLYRDR